MKFWKYFHSMVLGSVVRNNCQTMTYLKSETWDLSLLVGPLTQDLEPISWVGPGILKSAQDPRPKTQDPYYMWNLRPNKTWDPESGDCNHCNRWDPRPKTVISCWTWDPRTMIQNCRIKSFSQVVEVAYKNKKKWGLSIKPWGKQHLIFICFEIVAQK